MAVFHSVTECNNVPADSRYLFLEAEYFDLTREQADSLIEAFVVWCEGLFSEGFVTDWSCNRTKGREKTGKPEKLLSLFREGDVWAIGFDGAVRCNTIYNKTSYRTYLRTQRYSMPGRPRGSDVSEDYWAFYRTQAAKIKSGELDWISGILSFFEEPYRVRRTILDPEELLGVATKFPYWANNGLFHGNLRLQVPIYCLGDGLHEMANAFSAFLECWAGELSNLNGRVAISPFNGVGKWSGYMRYFGSDEEKMAPPPPQGYFPIEWYKYAYLCGAEWFNVVSPLVQIHLPTLWTDAQKTEEILANRHSNGNISLKLDQDPETVDVEDLRKMKDLLYDGLYPGMGRMLKSNFFDPTRTTMLTKPRVYWECVPIRREELLETEDAIIFRHMAARENVQ